MIKITQIQWDSICDWYAAMEAVQGEQERKKKGNYTFSQSTSLSMQRSSVNPETGIFWSKAKAKPTLATWQWGPVTHHPPKEMKRIRLSTNT